MLRLILAHQIAALTTSLLTLQPRGQLLMQAFAGDTAAVAGHISRGASLVALWDLLISPSAGALSDRIGRKPLMLLAPAVALPLKLATALRPSAGMLLLERVIGDAMRTIGGTTMAYACLSDLFRGEAYTAALAQVNSATGLGIVVAPLLASLVMVRGGGPRRAYLASALLAGVHLAVGAVFLEETLLHGGSSAKAGAGAVAEPLIRPVARFLRLFTSGARIRLRACLFALHCLVEGKVLQDQVSVLQLSLGWDTHLRARWTSGLGLAILAGGQATGGLVRRLGEHWFTALCHAASVLAFLGLRQNAFWGGLALLTLGQQRRTASASWVISEAHRLGIGGGEVIGWTASLRALMEAVSGVVYGLVYRARQAKGRPFDVFLLPAAVTLLAEALRANMALRSC